MTLVITEVSKVGIAMAADSAITYGFDTQGRPIEKQQKQWEKLIRVPAIKAAVSYWGVIGKVHRQFNLWLKRVVDDGWQSGSYGDLGSFADYLADAMNKACGGKPLSGDQYVGIHVAGYSKWPDGERRPVFYHVHNGHLRVEIHAEHANVQGREIINAVHPKLVADPRKLFEKHQDFPRESETLEANLKSLEGGYITRNGHYFIYVVLARQIQQALDFVNLIPNVSIPRNPSSLGSRKGYIHLMLETMVRIYACSNMGEIVCGEVSSLGIGPKGYIQTRMERPTNACSGQPAPPAAR